MNRLIPFVFATLLLAGAAVPFSSAQERAHEGHLGGRPVPREILERPVAVASGPYTKK